MMFARFLNFQGIAGIAVSLALAIMLLVQKGETHHWRKQSAGFEQRYDAEHAAFAETVANARAAAEAARAADQANAARVAAGQHTINERTADEFETRLAAARAAAANLNAGRLRLQPQASAPSGAGGSAPVPGVPVAAGKPAQAASQVGLPASDRLTATEQAIQLDELIKWVRAQVKVDPNPPTGSTIQPRPR